MVWRIFFGNEAEQEDQGGFCDKDSTIHYGNESKENMLNRAAKFEEHGGSDIRTKDGRDPNDRSDATRFNYHQALLPQTSQQAGNQTTHRALRP
jgi:hypothetical protein